MSTGIAVCIGILVVATLLWLVYRPRGEHEALTKALGEGAALLDVRRPDEVARAFIPGALNIPVAELEERMNELDRSRPLIVFCASGVRSRRAVGLLTSHGFTVHDGGPYRSVAQAIERVQSGDGPTSTPDSRE